MNRMLIGNGGVELRPDKRRHGTTEYWNTRVGFIPKAGEIIVYDDAIEEQIDNETVYHPNIKIGTGDKYVQDLPFLGQYESAELLERIIQLEELVRTIQIQSDAHYTYEWRTLQSSVTVQHNLHKKPSVTVTDTAGNELFCDVVYTDDNNVTLTFSEPVRGTAYFN